MKPPPAPPGSDAQLSFRSFDPLRHGFVLLPKHRPPGDMKHYEWCNHACVDGTHDYHRLNGYLSQDGEFVTKLSVLLDFPLTPQGCLAFGPIGLGCVTFGREIGEPEAFALMDHAVGRGVRLFDTAAAYGDGASERIVGRWWAARPSAAGRVVVATKVLPPYTPENIFALLRACRQRLEPARIDLLYLHRWDETLETPGALEALEESAVSAGVTWLGASNFSAAQLARAVQRQVAGGLRSFRVVQNNHNYAVRALDDELLALCAATGIAPVGYSPLGAGFLTGKHRAGVVPGSRFDVIPGHQRIYFTPEPRARLARLEEVALRTGHTPVTLALAWALRRKAVTVLVGGRQPAHLDQALAAVEFRDPAALASLELSVLS